VGIQSACDAATRGVARRSHTPTRRGVFVIYMYMLASVNPYHEVKEFFFDILRSVYIIKIMGGLIRT
jgi:hypothetical protein